MKSMIVILLVVGCSFCKAQRPEKEDGNRAEPSVSEFNVNGVSAMQALLELSRSANVPLGIVADDDRLCKSQVSYSGKDVPPRVAVKAIVSQVPGYGFNRAEGSALLLVAPNSARPVTEQFLNLVDERFGPMKANLQTLVITLWVHVRYILNPNQGTAGNILSSPNDRVFEIGATNATVEQLLNNIALTSRGAWVLRPLPATLSNLGGDLPFAVFSSFDRTGADPAKLCTPVTEQAGGQ